MIDMKNASDERTAMRAIVKIIMDQKVLEKHQRAAKASVETLQDSMVYAYDQIIEALQPFMDGDVSRVGALAP
jgi:hypothetical protein